MLAQQKDAEQRADEGLHVEEHAGLRCGNLGEAPVPEQRGDGGAEDSAGGERGPGLERDAVDRRQTLGERNPDGQHERAG